MDLAIIKKKISTYRTEKGLLRKVPDELLMEILQGWESWSGPAIGFYTAIGVSHRKMASLMGKAKKLKREGHFPVEEFKEIKVAEGPGLSGPCQGIEISWENGKLIRFPGVDELVEFLKKVA